MASGTTAGYLVGFIVAAAVVGYLAERRQDRDVATSIPAMLAGTAVIYVFGSTTSITLVLAGTFTVAGSKR